MHMPAYKHDLQMKKDSYDRKYEDENFADG